MNLGLETGEAAPALIAALRPRAIAARLWAERTLPKGSPVFAATDGSDDVVLLLSGLVKLVYTTAEGEDWIKSFIFDQGVFSGRGAADTGPGESYGAVCLEPCRFVRLPRSFVESAVAEDAGVRAAYDAFAAWIIARKQGREAALLLQSPETRYRTLLQSHAFALARLPQGDIARFLGITPVAFSRIKRRLATPDPTPRFPS